MLVMQSLVAVATKDENGISTVTKIESAEIENFTQAIIGGLFNSGIADHHEFALGYAAAIDAFCAGKIDFEDPLGAVESAYRDIYSITNDAPVQTDIMKTYCYGVAGGC